MQFNYKNKSTLLITILCVWCVLISTSSCKKLIDIGQPLTTLTTAKVFTSNEDVNSALAGLYSQMMSGSGISTNFSNGAATLYGGLSADELVSQFDVASPEEYQFQTNKILYNNSIPGAFWTPAYKNIYTTNAALEGIAASTATTFVDSARRQATGEFKFVRAFNYFYLTNFFGDVPLALTTDFNVTAKLSRAPQTDVYKQIIQDLKDAQTLLPADYSFMPLDELGVRPRIRPNRQAATALLARTYLYMKNWNDAETQASAVIGDSQYQLIGLDKVFLRNSNETIWQLQPNKKVIPYGINDAKNFQSALRWADIPADQTFLYLDPATYASLEEFLTPLYYFTPQLANAFETDDQRKVMWATYRQTPSVAPYDGVTIYYPEKYKEKLASSSQTEYYMILRLAEQYLIRAEARAQLGNIAGAASDINAIRNRAGLGDTKADNKETMLTAIAHERQVELFAEFGHRWFDLKRTGKAASVLGAIATKKPFDPNQLLYPIPASELKNGPRLVQNPGYNN